MMCWIKEEHNLYAFRLVLDIVNVYVEDFGNCITCKSFLTDMCDIFQIHTVINLHFDAISCCILKFCLFAFVFFIYFT